MRSRSGSFGGPSASGKGDTTVPPGTSSGLHPGEFLPMPSEKTQEVLALSAARDATAARVLARRLGEWNAPEVFARLSGAIRGRERLPLRLDLGAVESLSSTALGALVALHRRLRDAGG